MTAEEFKAHMAEFDALSLRIVEEVADDLRARGATEDMIAEEVEQQRQTLADRRRTMLQRMARIIANPDAPSVASH